MPLPTFSEDDVVNYMVAEALVARAAKEEADASKDRERQEWMSNSKGWAQEQGLLGGGR